MPRRLPYLHVTYTAVTNGGDGEPARLDVSIQEEQDGTRRYTWADDNAYPIVTPDKAADALATALVPSLPAPRTDTAGVIPCE